MSSRGKIWLLTIAMTILTIYFITNHNIFKTWKMALSLPSSDVQKFVSKSELIWEESVKNRHKLVNARGLYNIFGRDLNVKWWDYFYPSFNCPTHLERVGRIGDGGKWICGFSVFVEDETPCVVYSFGVNDDSSFEDEIISRSKCEIWAYDPTVDNMANSLQNHSRVHFEKMGISNEDTETTKTLGELMRVNDHKWIDILKMDIEGTEYRAMEKAMSEFEELPIGQLLVELHINLNRISFPNFYKWWEKLEAKGMRPVSNEPNFHGAGTGLFVEYTFLNVKTKHKVIE